MRKFLRETSIDELPQLFNVRKGDMSLVGHRLIQVRDFEAFDQDCHHRRFSFARFNLSLAGEWSERTLIREMDGAGSRIY